MSKQEEEEKLLSASPVWLKEILVFAINTGLRQGEILDLKWGRVNLFRRTVAILEQKNKGNDTLPLNGKAFEVLKARAKVRHLKIDHVFYNGAGNRIEARNLLRAFYSAVKKAGLEGLSFMIFAILFPKGWCRPVWICTLSIYLGGGKRFSW